MIFSRYVGCLFTLNCFPMLCRSFLVWCNPICLFLLLISVLFGVVSRKLLPVSISWSISPLFSSSSFRSHIKIFDSFWADFCAGWEIGGSVFCTWVSSFPSTSPMYVFGTFAKNQLAVNSLLGFPFCSISHQCIYLFWCQYHAVSVNMIEQQFSNVLSGVFPIFLNIIENHKKLLFIWSLYIKEQKSNSFKNNKLITH
jgi:hypothetical protein